MNPAAIAIAGLLYAAAAFAAAIAVGNISLPEARAKGSIDGYRVRLICVTFAGAAIGCFAQTRELTPLQSLATGLIVAALSGAIAAEPSAPRPLLLLTSSIPAGFVILSAALEASWPSVFAALLAAVPFLITAILVADRTPTLLNAAVAALAGAATGMERTFLILCAASVCGLAVAKFGRRSLATLRLAPYIAAFTLLGVLLDMSILT